MTLLESKVKEIIKRDGSKEPFDPEKVFKAIKKAVIAVGGTDFDRTKYLAQEVIKSVEEKFTETTPSVEDIQDLVEKTLINEGHATTAKAYILFRQKRKEFRELATSILEGKKTRLKLSENSLIVLKERYLWHTPQGIETPEELFTRVAKAIASTSQQEKDFYTILSNLDFLPSTPTLINAGKKEPQLLPAHVLPIEDSLASIYETLKNAVLIQKSGSGTGFSFSRLRPKQDRVNTIRRIASGPIHFMKLYNKALDTVLQIEKRKGANMAILRIDHPEIMDFITLKSDNEDMKNFNLSVAITDEFMKAVENNTEYNLINPRTGEITQRIAARQVFDMLVLMAWKTGDPGIVFIDRINNSRSNPTPKLGRIESTNPCGEAPLLPSEACPFGSINLAHHVKDMHIDYDKLKTTIHHAINFLDNIIDKTHYHSQETEYLCKNNRKIGLGIMGFADLLFQLKMPYDSPEAVALASQLMNYISYEADNASKNLAREKKPFPNHLISIYGEPLRNAVRTAISPTGSISMIANCSPGIEPAYALSYTKRVLGGKELLYINEHLENALKEYHIHTEELITKIASTGSIAHQKEIPDSLKHIFKTAHEITPEWHVKMQSAFQQHTDNAVSKTVNFPSTATTTDVANVYQLAYKLGCKGITIYRDNSKTEQVLTTPTKTQQTLHCPQCSKPLLIENNTTTCICGYQLTTT